MQALFSSTLALWRAKGAFALYAMSLIVLNFAFALVPLLGGMLGISPVILSMLSMAAGLCVTAVFYVSLWFSFADCFGEEIQVP